MSAHRLDATLCNARTLDGLGGPALRGVAANSNCFTRHASPVLAIDDARPWRVWAAMQQGLWLSVDGGGAWAEEVEAMEEQDLLLLEVLEW